MIVNFIVYNVCMVDCFKFKCIMKKKLKVLYDMLYDINFLLYE